MKKNYLTIAFAFFTFFTQAQLRLIDPETSTDVLSTYTVYLDAGSPTHSFDFELHNDYSTSKTIKSKRYLNSYTAGQDVYFCFGTNCYSAFTTPEYAPNQTVTLPSGGILPNGAGTYGLKTDFDDNSVLGNTQVRYTLYDVNNIADSISIIINYEVSSVGINELMVKNYFLSNASPNPASHITSIKHDFKVLPSTASIKVYNVAGVVVKETNLYSVSGETQIDVSDLESGLYFYSLQVNNQIISTKKLLVDNQD